MQKNNTKTTTNTMQRQKIKQDILHAWASEVVRDLQQDDKMVMILVTPMRVLMMRMILLMMLMILLARSCCCGKLVAAPWVARYSNTSPHYTILTRPTCLRRDHVWLLAISDTPITLATYVSPIQYLLTIQMLNFRDVSHSMVQYLFSRMTTFNVFNLIVFILMLKS